MIVRCIDNLFQADVLVEGREYEVRAERDDCYILSGFDKGFSKTRFEIVSLVGNGAQQIEQILRRPRQAIQAGNNGLARGPCAARLATVALSLPAGGAS